MGNETSKCKTIRSQRGDFTRYLHGHGIDIGCGMDPLRIDNGSVAQWDVPQGDAQTMKGALNESFDFAYSSHCLEHLESPRTALENWSRILKPEGYLYLVVPDYALYEKLRFPSVFNADHRHTFSLDIGREKVSRDNHWHIAHDLAPALANVGLNLLEARLEDDGFDYNLGPHVDQTTFPATLAQICIIARKNRTAETNYRSAATAKSRIHMMSRDPLGLLVEGGIGDVLTSFSEMGWLRKAYPNRNFIGLFMGQTPSRTEGMRNIGETHPALHEVHTVANPAELRRRFPHLPFINISPWHFQTAYSRFRHPALDYHLTLADLDTSRSHVSALEAPPIVLHPFASNPQVNWSVERWQELVDRLVVRHPVVLVGGRGEPVIARATLDLRGTLTVRESIALARVSAGAIVARSYLGIVTMDANCPTIVMTPPTHLCQIEYAYAQSYFDGATAHLVDLTVDAARVQEIIEASIAQDCRKLRGKDTL